MSCCDSCATGGVCKGAHTDKIPGGIADKKSPKDFDQAQLEEGVKHELEHTNDESMAQEIAMDHLAEDPHYYTKLREIEKTLSVGWKVQKNFKVHRKVKFQGLDISIEHDKGMVRHWKDDQTGEEGSTTMHYPYGYICRTDGNDGEQVDVYVGPNPDSEKVYVIHQMKRPNYKRYDEDKVMVGFSTPKEAKQAYLMHFDDPRFFGSMTETDVTAFKRMFVNKALGTRRLKKWVRDGGKKCTTGVCEMLDGVTVPDDQPFPYTMEALGYSVMAPPAHKNCECSMEYVNEPLKRSIMPNAPMMDPMMVVDPHDVETFEGVQSLIGRMGSVKDPELMDIASKIWGSGYNFEGQSPYQARAEILGFLMDQRDLLGVEPYVPENPGLQPSPSLPVKEPLGSSEYYGSSPTAEPQAVHAVNSYEEESTPPPSTNSSEQDYSSNPQKQQYGGTR